jgi:hypothetical protein
MSGKPLWKDGITPKKKRAKQRRQRNAGEQSEKAKVRERDVVCRFPLCGCKRGVRPPTGHSWLTVSHDRHKGMGGDPSGNASIAALMVLLCAWRHQEASVSRHAGTLNSKYLTPDQNDGPLAWLVDLSAVYPGLYATRGVWFEVARECYVEGGSGELRLEPLTDEQQHVLDDLGEMDR